MNNGLTLHDLEELEQTDIRIIPSLIEGIRRIERIERLKAKLDMAQAFNFAYVGSKSNRHSADYARWQRSIEREINKLNGIVTESIWDKLKRSRKL